jgi:hypothetical protein
MKTQNRTFSYQDPHPALRATFSPRTKRSGRIELLAIKTLIRRCAPPSPLAQNAPGEGIYLAEFIANS